jgi:acylphosphatase
MQKEVYIKVYGEVQGVFYRAFAQEKAHEFKVTGSAKNCDDGSVEVIAQGDEAQLKQFLESISAGPENAQVESLEVEWGKIVEPIAGFLIE